MCYRKFLVETLHYRRVAFKPLSQIFQHCAYHRLQKQLWERLRRPILWWANFWLVQFKTYWPTRQTRPVPTAVQEGLYKWGNGEEEHPAEVDRYVSCYGLCDWRGGEETKNGLALNDLLYWRLFLFQVELYINGAKSPQKNKKPIERPEDHAGLVFMLFHKLYFYEFWIVSESLWWSV